MDSKSVFQQFRSDLRDSKECFTHCENVDTHEPFPNVSKHIDDNMDNNNDGERALCDNVSTAGQLSRMDCCENYGNVTQVQNNAGTTRHQRRTRSELGSYSTVKLRAFLEDLAVITKEVSSELVCLLQENDRLQQESDARNIAIEQLLKMTVHQADGGEVLLRPPPAPVQMSVVVDDHLLEKKSPTWD